MALDSDNERGRLGSPGFLFAMRSRNDSMHGTVDIYRLERVHFVVEWNHGVQYLNN